MRGELTRREVIQRMGHGVATGVATLVARHAHAQAPQSAQPSRVSPPSVVSSPPRDFSPGAPPVTYPDPDVLTIDPAFNALRLTNTSIQRLWTGGLWCEGPAWCSQGRYLVWSDIPNNRQMRYLDDDGRVTVFRYPSNNSNGNTFDFQGRQLSCEHGARRVVRYEHDGSVTVIADTFQDKRLNSPNDIAVHRDGSIWFTDPPFGGSLYEGMVDAAGGPSNPRGLLNPKAGQPAGSGTLTRELPSNVYRVDPSGRIDLVISEQDLGSVGNGIAFAADFKRVFIVARGGVVVADIGADNRISAPVPFSNFMVDGVRCGPDGIRTDVYGNLWCGSNAGNNVGYSGVTVHSPQGTMIGRIRLPEVCANLTFGGPKRNRLFMAAGQSLYAVYVNTQGAAAG
ncbi:MAG: SMP-30/gluconolactonase/LRE family protein [Vicinamibacterales bacterium]